jgi:hypothetical protein
MSMSLFQPTLPAVPTILWLLVLHLKSHTLVHSPFRVVRDLPLVPLPLVPLPLVPLPLVPFLLELLHPVLLLLVLLHLEPLVHPLVVLLQ